MASEIIGKTIAGCEVTELIGQGGMGLVYKARHLVLDQYRALKVMDPYIARDELFMKRFQSEARSLARLRSPYIVTVHDLCETEIGTCLIMEYVKGQTLADVLKNSSGPLEERRMFHIFKQILMAIEHAHGANVIHRDIKPGNILVTDHDEVKVTDFGLAKIQEHTSTTVTQLTGGTIFYMPPEQLEGLGKVDHRGDIYSIGMTLYECLTGAVPFEKTESDFGIREKIVKGKIPPPKKRNPKVSDGLNAVVLKAIAREPERRYQTAAEMRVALEKAEGQYSGAVQIKKASPGVNYRKYLIPAVGAVLVLLVSYLVYRLLSPSSGVLTIKSSPSNARVELNGKGIGYTPLVGLQASPGAVALRLEKQDYESKDTTFVLGAGDSLGIVVYLMGKPIVAKRDTVVPKPVVTSSATDMHAAEVHKESSPPPASPSLLYLSTTPSNVDVFIDRVPQKTKPPFRLEPGRHTLRVVSGTQVWEKGMRLSPGRNTRISLDFTKQLRITVLVYEPDASGNPNLKKAIPGCSIIVDGIKVASSTPKLIFLAFGRHTITVKHPDYGEADSKTDTFEEDMKLRFTLKKKS